jgi:hypothetical protein
MSINKRLFSIFVVLCGPLLSFLVLTFYSSSLKSSEVLMIQFLLILMWSPLFFSIPAYILQDSRDAALSSDKGVVRGIKLMWFLTSSKHKENYIFIASLIGWAVLLLLAYPSIFYVFNLVFS